MRTTTAPQETKDAVRAPKSLVQSVRDGRILPPPNEVVGMHACGLVVVHASTGEMFAARMEALRSFSGPLQTRILERQSRTPSHEPFGGIGSPLVRMTLGGTALFGPRSGHRLVPLKLTNEQVFVREDAILGFDLALTFENGKLPFSEGEALHVVQLKGTGSIVLELLDPWVSLEANADRGITVRRESLLGWMGRLVPRTLPPNEAPSAQRGLITLVGEGTVLVSGR